MTKRLIDYAEKHASVCFENDAISPILYKEYGVNTGLRDEKGTGVLTGLTRVSDIVSSKIIDGRRVPCDGELWYRGYRIEELISSIGDDASGFDKIAYLLLMGELPTQQQILEFSDLISQCRTLPTNFTRDVIMKVLSDEF